MLVLVFHAARAADPGDSGAPSIERSPYIVDRPGVQWRPADRRVAYGLVYTNDVLANVHGGNRRGAIDQGKLEGLLYVEPAGWRDTSFFANGFVIHNTGRMRRDYVGGNNTIAAIEAVPAVRLSEVWLEQRFWDGAASVHFGQLAADSEFFFSGLSAMFLQSDWPTITALNLPSGGPAYPLSTPGVRLKIDPASGMSLLFAVFNGDPAGPGPGDEQRRNRNGLSFRVSDPPLLIAEAQLRTGQGRDDARLARTLKLGAWAHRGQFSDQRMADDGTRLADPAGSGVALRHRGTSGVYAVIDQQLYRPPGGDAESGVSVFSRIAASPSDRNPIDFYLDGGVVFAGLIPGRPGDKFGVSAIYARFSRSLRDFDRDKAAFTGTAGPIRDYEANLELTYVAEITPRWSVQPVATIIRHPDGDATRNALVTGVRSIWRF